MNLPPIPTASATRTVDSTPPATPSGFTAVGSTSNITLSWSANTEPDLAGYNLYRSSSLNGTYTKLNSTPLTGLSFVDTGATVSLPSYYQLKAVDVSANQSTVPAQANAVRKDTVKPATPAGLTATGAVGGITLGWSVNTETDLAGYNVYRSTSLNGTESRK